MFVLNQNAPFKIPGILSPRKFEYIKTFGI